MSIWGFIAAFAILGIWSFVFKDNVIYRCVQGLYLGLYAGIAFANGIILVIDTNIVPFIHGEVLLILPLIFGILLYFRVFGGERFAWLSRISMGFTIGVGTAVATFGAVNGQLVEQLKATVVSLLPTSGSGIDPLGMANNLVILVGMLSVFAYFLFSKASENQLIRKTSVVGRYFMMISFGVAFGNSIINRITAFMESLQTILVSFGIS